MWLPASTIVFSQTVKTWIKITRRVKIASCFLSLHEFPLKPCALLSAGLNLHVCSGGKKGAKLTGGEVRQLSQVQLWNLRMSNTHTATLLWSHDAMMLIFFYFNTTSLDSFWFHLEKFPRMITNKIFCYFNPSTGTVKILDSTALIHTVLRYISFFFFFLNK